MALTNGLSSVSWKIHTDHYKGPASPELVVDNGYTRASGSKFPNHSFSFDNISGIKIKNWQDLMKYTLTYKIVSDEKNGLGYVITTAGGPNSTSNKFIPIVDLSYDGKPTL